MVKFRILYTIIAGIGCYCGLSLDNYRKNRFILNAADPANVGCPKPNLLFVQSYGKYGIPNRDVILRYNDFEMSYDNRNRQPNWVLEHLTRESVNPIEQSAKRDKFRYEYHEDRRIPRFFQSGRRDYGERFLNSRLASPDNYKNRPLAMNDTFIYANTSPQDRQFNTSHWEQLENYVRNQTLSYENVYVFTGPLFKSSDGKNMQYRLTEHRQVAVPTHFFKIIIGETKDKSLHVGCFVLPNRRIFMKRELNDFRASLDDVEKMTGFKLFRVRPFAGFLQDENQEKLVVIEWLNIALNTIEHKEMKDLRDTIYVKCKNAK
uniref:Endonuclease n=1 Tax=Strigamia maritima TaxID=126957 RepID=T1IHG9_STRMM